MANKPVFTRRLDRVEAAIWQDESEDSNWHNITFQRTCRDEQGAIQNTSNPNRPVQFLLGGHLGSPGETALDTAHQTELTAVRKPLTTNQLSIAHFISR